MRTSDVRTLRCAYIRCTHTSVIYCATPICSTIFPLILGVKVLATYIFVSQCLGGSKGLTGVLTTRLVVIPHW